MVVNLINLDQRNLVEVHDLFKAVYPNYDIPFFHWTWMINCPNTYVPVGLYDNKKLVGFYSALLYGDMARMHGAMIHPDHRRQGYYKMLSDYIWTLDDMRGIKFAELFSNEMILPVHKKNGYVIDCQIKEYRIDIEETPKIYGQLYQWTDAPTTLYDTWRYTNNIYKDYFYYIHYKKEKRVVFSVYEGRLQIVEFDDFPFAIILAHKVAEKYGCKQISFWSEDEFPLEYTMIPRWRMYKTIENFIGIKSNRRLRMGDNTDVY